jgi:hypothetical protein
MRTASRYIMQDQVRDFVPALVHGPRQPGSGRRFSARACLELAVFALALTSYVAALALTA